MTEEALFDLASNTPEAWRAASFDRGITDFCDASKLTPANVSNGSPGCGCASRSATASSCRRSVAGRVTCAGGSKMSRLSAEGVRVLLVEDEPEIAHFVTAGLREEGYVAEHAADGARGWARLAGEPWDVVLLDWWLPGLDGLTLLKRFRAINATTPVIFLTARDAVSDRVRGLDAGAEDYLCKPFAFEELLARVRSLTRRLDRQPVATLTRGDVTLDFEAQRATRGGKRLDLTAKEFALLALFLRHPDAALSRARIYEQVWDEEYDGLSNTLAVHVGELRRKLEAHGPRLVHTVRGVGYALRDGDA